MQRVQKIRSILEEKQIDAVLIKSRSDKRYLGALTGSGVKVSVARDGLYRIVDGRYSSEAKETTNGLIPVVYRQGSSYLDEVVRLLGNHTHIGVEAGQVLVKEHLSIQEYRLKTVSLECELEEAHRCKGAQEIALVRRACEITDVILQETISAVRIGMKKTEVGTLLQYLIIKSRASAMIFDTTVVSSARDSMPYGRPSGKAFEAHEFITIDSGITYQGYQSDMTGMACIQKPEPELKEIYNIVLEVQCAGVDFIRAGTKGDDVDNCARGIIQGHGYGPYFTHGLGYGINMGDKELPLLNVSSDTMLKEDMIMSCEPGVYVPGLGGVRTEDDALIENNCDVSLSAATKELTILEGNGYEV